MAQQDEKAAPDQKQRFRVIVNDPPKFDLDSYISNYEGPTRIERLLTIGCSSRYLSLDALKLAIAELKAGKNVNKYLEAVQLLSEAAPNDPLSVPDTKWIENTQKQVKLEMDRLELELKGYKNNLIKESIRMGNEELGGFYYDIGDYSSAFKAYSRMRENCTTQKHICEMNLKLMLVVAAQDGWRSMPSYVAKVNSSQLKNEDKAKIDPVLAPCLGLAALETGDFAAAARHFIQTDPTFLTLEPIAGIRFSRQLLTSNDITIYGALTALATMDRAALQLVLDNPDFRNFLELEPHLRRAIAAFCASKYTTALHILAAYRPDYLLDVHLQRHVPELFSLVRRKSIVQYFRPYSCVALSGMAAAFAASVPEMTAELVAMIEAGELDARIDVVNGLLVAAGREHRAQVHARTVAMAAQHEGALRLRVFRVNCQQAGLEVKAPKGQRTPLEGDRGAGRRKFEG